MKIIGQILVIFFLVVFTSCSSSNSGNNDNNLILEAQQAINQYNFTDALSYLSGIQTQTDQVVELTISAYAGLAGFRSLKIYDTVYNNENINPVIKILFLLSQNYKTVDLNNSRLGLQAVESYNLDIATRSNDVNMPFALLEFYKISQILLKDSDLENLGTYSSNWNPCSSLDFPISDVTETIVALNKGIIALNQIRLVLHNTDIDLIFTLITQIQADLGIDNNVLDETEVKSEDVAQFRTYINNALLANNNICQ
jgi:hypothetical protein